MRSKRIGLVTAFTAIAILATMLGGAPAQAASLGELEVCSNSGCEAGENFCYLAMGCKCFMVANKCTGDESCAES